MFLFEQDFNLMVPKKKPKKNVNMNKLLLHVYYMTRQIRTI